MRGGVRGYRKKFIKKDTLNMVLLFWFRVAGGENKNTTRKKKNKTKRWVKVSKRDGGAPGTLGEKKARAIALMDSKKMWRSNFVPLLLGDSVRSGIRVSPLPLLRFCQGRMLLGACWGILGGVYMGLISRGLSDSG
ncbi:hypothetical protein KCA24_35170, partial [Escherichia coli]|nr:hypothetical protein [Escherichia coli]